MISPSRADSRTRLVSNSPPSPVSCRPSLRARSTNIVINRSSDVALNYVDDAGMSLAAAFQKATQSLVKEVFGTH